MTNELFLFRKNALQGVLTNPLCAEYRNDWRACGNDKDSLVKLVMQQQAIPYFVSHCYQGKGLSKEYIKENFAEYINDGERSLIKDADGVEGYTYSLYVAAESVLRPLASVSCFMWCNPLPVEINSTKCPVIYCACKSELHLTCEGYNFVQVYLFDESKLVVDDADETCNVIVRKYSDKCSVEKGKYCLCDVREFQKTLKL